MNIVLTIIYISYYSMSKLAGLCVATWGIRFSSVAHGLTFCIFHLTVASATDKYPTNLLWIYYRITIQIT